MTAIDNRPDVVSAIADVADDAGRAISEASGWLTTADHKRIGRLFIGSGLLFGLAALAVGVILGVGRLDPADSILQSDAVGQLFSLHRVALSFLVVAPLLLGICLAVVPLQLGSRSLAFPRAAALGYWAWDFGAVMVIIAFIANGGPGGGEPLMVDLFLLGLALSLIGLVIAAASLVVTVLTSRAPGMTLDRVPMLAWSALVGGVALVISLPVLVGDLVLLAVDHQYANQAFGGNARILSWIGWSMTQPATFVLVIPALGAVVDILVTVSRRRHPMRGVIMAGIGIFATAMLAAVTQVPHELRWSGTTNGDKIKDLLPYAFFNLLPLLGVFVTIATAGMVLQRNKPKITAGLLFGLLGGMCVLGGVATHALTPIVDLQLGGTVYEEGVFVLLTGGAILAALGALAHWGPKLSGRQLPKAIGGLALLGFAGTKLAALPLLVAGFQGQPAGAVTFGEYELSPQLLNGIAAVGQLLLFAAVLFFALALLASFIGKGAAAGDDPWDGQTLEWATSSPPPADNFADLHTVSSAEPLLDLKPAGSNA